MKAKNICVVASVLAISSVALAIAPPNPDEIYIRDMYYNGTGCPNGTVDGTVSSDGTVFSATYSAFVAEDGPVVPRTERRKFCNLTLDLHAPSGYRYSIFVLNTEGYVDLDANASAKQTVDVRFSGDSIDNRRRFSSEYYGPRADEFFDTDEIDVRSLVWSRCGGGIPMNIKTTISANAYGRDEAVIGVDQQDGRLNHKFGITWQGCDTNDPDPNDPDPDPNDPDFQYNEAPVVEAGAVLYRGYRSSFAYGRESIRLSDADVRDDGRPFGTLNVSWSQTMGPCNVVFDDRRLANPTIRLERPYGVYSCQGRHQIRLVVDDGAATNYDEKTIYIY